MINISTKAILAATAAATLITTGVTTALAHDSTPKTVAVQADQPAAGKKVIKKRLPAGVSTATSFWDPATASGRPMSYHTIASPYWPLGTTVKITYQGKSIQGVVEDFGPAEWAVAQHNPPALVDLSEKMMRDLTGRASNSVTVKFEVMKLGKGGVYRHSGTGFDEATGTD